MGLNLNLAPGLSNPEDGTDLIKNNIKYIVSKVDKLFSNYFFNTINISFQRF